MIYQQITVYIYMLYTCIPRHGRFRLGGESQYCQGDTDDETEDCPVPAAPGGEDFLPLTQLDPFIDFQPSQIFRRSQNGAPKENRGKEPPNIAYVFKVLFFFYWAGVHAYLIYSIWNILFDWCLIILRFVVACSGKD